ncbi:MAG: carboxylesterase/lipase family protein [Thermoleophilia bacterium]|nr:carboxylesterase/lipase family protein [Thermoleophilia bacterium]
MYAFKGVPYAAPPVGPRRWMPPQPLEPWQGVHRADRFRDTAPQNPMLGGPGSGQEPEPQSEDCLYLNIFTPGLDDTRRPVMVWIHGGAFTLGSGSSPMFDGSRLAKRHDVVVVTLNYRLGLLGFLNLNEVTGGRIPATGNEGLLDQAAALRWVRDHIAAFGGDPANVTVFGESAGAMSIACLLVMPAAEGLFDKAILESGVGSTAMPLADATAVGRLFLEVTGAAYDGVTASGVVVGGAADNFAAPDADALRRLTVEQLLAADLVMRQRLARPWEPMKITATAPVVDGRVLPDVPTRLSARGASKGIPLIIGTNLEEWRIFDMADPNRAKVDRAEIVRRLSEFVPAHVAPDVVERYYQARARRDDDTSAPELLTAITTDLMFRMPALQLVEAQRRHNPHVFNYLFTYRSPVMGGVFGACHALEMGFVFGTHDDFFCGTGETADRLSESIQGAWTTFARTGRPACDSAGAWPPYGDERRTMLIDVPCRLEAAPYDDERRAWDEAGELSNVLL